MAEEKKILIPGRLKNAAVGGHVAGTEDIYDDILGRTQNEINSDIREELSEEIQRAQIKDSEQDANIETLNGQVAFEGDFHVANTAAEIVDSGGDAGAKITSVNAISGVLKGVGYFECNTAASTANKTIAATGYSLRAGGCIKIKMINANTADNATLTVGSTAAKPLFYGNERASAGNTWEAGEVVEVYYDPSYNSNTGAFYANNVAGGSGDGAFDISKYKAVNGTPATYRTLAEALGTNGANVPSNKRKGGMTIKYIQLTDATYNLVKTEGLETQPTGVELQSAISLADGVYTGSQLPQNITLPQNIGTSTTYYLTVTETVDEQEVTTYTMWVVTKLTNDITVYVQWMLKNTTWSIVQSDWEDNSLSELLKDEYTIAEAINDIKYKIIPDEFTQVFQKSILTEDIHNTVWNGTLQNNGVVSGSATNGMVYCIKNEGYSKIDAWVRFTNSYSSFTNACSIAFFSSEIIDSSHLISVVPKRTQTLSYYTASVPNNTKLICINAGALNGTVYDGQDFIIYRDLRKLEYHNVIDSLVIKDKERALSANKGEELFDSIFYNDAAHARAMQAGRPFMKNVFLDCGRKYFSVENIKRIIDTMYIVDLRNLVLDFSNHNAFRFSLDDMIITTDDGITYDLSQSLSADYLTESDMNDIISYAKNKNVGIIAGVNLPGHASKLLHPFFSNVTAINLNSEIQKQFGIAVTKKYAEYFKSKGCDYYYLGGDESGKHINYGAFMNRCMNVILKNNMIPLIWNDQICRRDNGNINIPYINDGAICMFWGANNQSASTIEKNNFQQINSSMSIYWTLGYSTKPTVASISNFDINVFNGNTIVRKNIVGAQFCMWMDGVGGSDDKDNDGTDVVDRCLPLIEAFGNIIKTQTGIARISTYRPTRPTAGDFFFDTALNKPIWYNGTNWVDATGTIV